MNSTPAASAWPRPLSEEAHYGLAGEVVRTIEPHTESDPAALLIQLLVAFGNVIDRGPYWQAEADRHALNLFAVLVGVTSKARKGSSWAHIRNLMSGSDELWGNHSIQTGLSSGEGLIYAVRDPRADDPGPLDKRLLVVESEFSSTLRMISRDGNTLSPVVRQAWDGGILQIMTKQFPLVATNAHVSIIGHITRDELRRELTRVDAANGFGNRFLWVCARRSKTLPDGGRVPQSDFDRLADQLKNAVKYGISLGDCEIRRTEEAKILWHSIYADLSEGKPSLFGAVTSRAEAQVMRVAGIYAVLDETSEIRKEHLRAGLEVWKYCEASARYVFGDALSDPTAETLLSKLRTARDGLTKTQLSAALGRNRPSAEIDQALASLTNQGLAIAESEETNGRTAMRWHATDTARPTNPPSTAAKVLS
jgi:hypothetical protein